jgi:sporulation protein YlmC with PRC-barrel domain
MRLVRELLDNQLLDRRGRKLGKVDGILLVLREGQPPRVAALETGAVVLARRISPRLARGLGAVVRRWRLPVRVTRIAWGRVRSVGREVRVDVDAERAGATAFERWLETRVVGRIPGAGP